MYSELSLKKVCGSKTKALAIVGRERNTLLAAYQMLCSFLGFVLIKMLERDKLELGGTSVVVRIAVGLRI